MKKQQNKNMLAVTIRRILWAVCPLVSIACYSATEWPARIEMLDDGVFKEVLYKPAVEWKNTVERTSQVMGLTHVKNQTEDSSTASVTEEPTTTEESVVNEPIPVEEEVKPTEAQPVASVQQEKTEPVVVAMKQEAPVQIKEITPPAVEKKSSQPKFILAVGDSLMSEVSQGLRAGLDKSIKVKDVHKSSTGLTNLDYYDWPDTAYKNVVTYKPDWVIIHLGGNDGQDMKIGNRFIRMSNPEWSDIYYSRATKLIDKIRTANPNVNIVWLGLPAMRDSKFANKIDIIRKAQEKAARNNNVIYVDSVNEEGLGNTYKKQAKINGKTLTLRRTDGIHYTRDGGIILSNEIIHSKSLQW